MKKSVFLFVISLFLAANSLYAQDIMTLKTGEELEVIVTDITRDMVIYKKFSNPDGPNYSLPQSDIFMIKYVNGDKDLFVADNQAQTPAPVIIQNYNRKEPVLSCVLSWILPGGGQYYNGEYGKGVLMTGLFVGSLIGMATSLSDSYYYYNDYHARSEDGAALFALVLTGTYLWSIIDAPISSNKINRQNRLSWNLNQNTNLMLQPDVRLATTLPTGTFYSPSYGAKLVLSLK
ncbi:MAG: hypothetical protein LBN18_07415 [Dysgonamonadaceae bacterium]|nr:hypothetical protein [Dysgonamonadaceae bacterium]